MLNHLKIIKLDTVDSTNKYAWRLAEKGEDEVVVVISRAQTRGHGRRNRQWFSPKDKGVYVSFLLRPRNNLHQVCLLPLILSLSVVRLFKDVLPLKIKWPNDVMSGNKKIAGILVQARSKKDKVDFVVAGIGINIQSRQEDLPPEATSVYIETAKTQKIDEVLKKLITEVNILYKEFKAGNIKALLDEILLYQVDGNFSLDGSDLKDTIQLG
ncbi:MAG: biotin--[acetyl-CoA-carboxylase] ligase [Candidatus Omnitrophota bacterium]|nr:biotin--[acetyl-CoA-carboxylase] ligase [Candidatus Omnitrophota bacterium]